jgi:hypothetical protein
MKRQEWFIQKTPFFATAHIATKVPTHTDDIRVVESKPDEVTLTVEEFRKCVRDGYDNSSIYGVSIFDQIEREIFGKK